MCIRDRTQTGKDARGIPQFAANPGGAPANLAVAAARLGAQTAFIGKVGADAFGRYLKEVLEENKVDVSGMAVDADHPTTMAVVSVDATGERDFSFYRSANADVMLCKEDISDEALKAAKIVHFGSVSLTADPSRTATLDLSLIHIWDRMMGMGKLHSRLYRLSSTVFLIMRTQLGAVKNRSNQYRPTHSLPVLSLIHI